MSRTACILVPYKLSLYWPASTNSWFWMSRSICSRNLTKWYSRPSTSPSFGGRVVSATYTEQQFNSTTVNYWLWNYRQMTEYFSNHSHDYKTDRKVRNNAQWHYFWLSFNRSTSQGYPWLGRTPKKNQWDCCKGFFTVQTMEPDKMRFCWIRIKSVWIRMRICCTIRVSSYNRLS